ncbi:hypothetical protein [Methanoregula sp.]|jgi:hypothetical protein|uniref:hypothetical protein n=1 Tax=Methanoregula sp. TaxID=2052170 RepID=UPI003565C939
MKNTSWFVVLCAIVTIGCCTQIAGATPPPPEYRAMYLLPNPAGLYYNQSVNSGFLVTSSQNTAGASPYFPGVSQYRAFQNFTYAKTGDPYLSEVWYFDTWDSFATGREDLTDYLQKRGTISPVTLDISGDLVRTGDPWIAGLHATRINATAYRAADTSGYFIIFSTDFFPDENYYIAYYGTAGKSDLDVATPRLKTLIMSCFPGFVEGKTYTFDPVSPENPAAFLPATVVIITICCIGALVILQKKRGS